MRLALLAASCLAMAAASAQHGSHTIVTPKDLKWDDVASLPPGAKLWSKEGDTSEVRHDAAYVELPSGRKLVVVILTRGAADEKALLPSIGKHLLAELDQS